MLIDKIYNIDCIEGMKQIPDRSIDAIITDPPYEFKDTTGGGVFGTCQGKSASKKGRTYHTELTPISEGISEELLDEMCRVCKITNIYLFCNKDQVPQFINFWISRGLNFDILACHKPDPIPMCCNKYLSDTEYIIFRQMACYRHRLATTQSTRAYHRAKRKGTTVLSNEY